jgi:hypothetical protein
MRQKWKCMLHIWTDRLERDSSSRRLSIYIFRVWTVVWVWGCHKVSMNSTIFWNVMPWNLVEDYQPFGRTSVDFYQTTRFRIPEDSNFYVNLAPIKRGKLLEFPNRYVLSNYASIMGLDRQRYIKLHRIVCFCETLCSHGSDWNIMPRTKFTDVSDKRVAFIFSVKMDTARFSEKLVKYLLGYTALHSRKQ